MTYTVNYRDSQGRYSKGERYSNRKAAMQAAKAYEELGLYDVKVRLSNKTKAPKAMTADGEFDFSL